MSKSLSEISEILKNQGSNYHLNAWHCVGLLVEPLHTQLHTCMHRYIYHRWIHGMAVSCRSVYYEFVFCWTFFEVYATQYLGVVCFILFKSKWWRFVWASTWTVHKITTVGWKFVCVVPFWNNFGYIIVVLCHVATHRKENVMGWSWNGESYDSIC